MRDGKPRFRCARCERAIKTHPCTMDGAMFHAECRARHINDLRRIERLEVRAQAEEAWREFTVIQDAND